MNKLTESRTRHFEAANADFRAGLVHFALGFTYLFRAMKHIFAGIALSFVFITLFSQKLQAGYTEKFSSWTAAGAGAWEDKDLSGAFFSVPANAVCEIVIGNMESATANLGGVRANGSAINRYVLLQEAETGGADDNQFVTMFAQADASSIIECYAQDIANITFWLVGYWDSGTYVEKFSSFTVGASATWTVKDLTGDGVGANNVCEIVVANNAIAVEQEAGVRKTGSAIERKILLMEAEAGGVVPVSLIVKADSSSQVEVYAQTDGNVNLYLMGYWSANPTGFTYVSTFTTISNPSTELVWEDSDLSAGGHNVPANSVVEIVTGNDVATSSCTNGMRGNGSALSRQFIITKAEAGGLSCARAHVSADASSIIELYNDSHGLTPDYCFYLTGYWEPAVASDSTPPCGISDLTALAEGSDLGGRVQLKWSEPGDDGTMVDNSGGQYLVKYSSNYIGASDFYESWVSTWGYFTPGATPGAEILKVLTGFKEGTTYFFAIKTKDSDNNWAVWPGTATDINSSSWSVPTDSAPASITTLSALTGSSSGQVELSWTAPGDDGTTGAITGGKFAIRYATYTNVDWDASSGWDDFDDQYELVIDTDTNNYNEVHSRTMTSLHGGSTYYFRIKTGDEKPNWSSLSNHATAWACIPPDSTPPCAISDLTALAEGTGLGGQITLKWSAPGDDGTMVDNSAGAYEVKYATKYIGAADYAASWTNTYTQSWTPTATWGSEELKILNGSNFKEGTTYFFAIKTKDSDNNWSVWPGTATNINSSSWSVPTDSAPASITTLSALTGDSGGEIDLTWTCPGDDGTTGAITDGKFAIRYATYTNVDWTTASSEWTDFDDKYELVIDTDTNNYNEIHSRTMTSLHEGVEYYFRLKTADERPNWSALSNHATACAYVTPPPDSGAMCVYFSTPTAVANFPQYRTLTEATTIWSSVASASDAGAAVQYWHILKNSPAANEKILVTLDGAQDVNTQQWDGSSWSAAIEHTSDAGTYVTRVVDGCYEHSSGDFLIVYRNGATATPQYKTLAKGGSWSAAADVPNYALTGVPTWIRLESRLGSDSILLAAQDANADLFAMLWDGSNWLSVSSATLTTSLSNANQCWDIACEYQSGNFMVAYGTPTVSVKYRRLLAGTTSWEAEGSLTNADAAVRWVKLASEKKANSNYIICGNLDDGDDLDVQVWDGSSWGTSVEVSAGVVSDAKRAFDVEWEAASSQKGIVVYGQVGSQMPRYGTISGAVVSDIDGSALDVDDVTSNVPDTLKLMPDPYSDDIWLIYSVGHTASTATICAQRWQGFAANAWDGAKKLTKISYESAPYENFSIAYGTYPAPPPTDTTAPAAISNLTAIAGSDDGEVKLTWTAPGDDGAGGNVSSGLYRINAATYNITSANFGSITNNGKYTFTVDISTSYTTQGTEHSYGFSGLYPGTTYYFAIKLRDESNNWSSWSDTASSSDTAPAQDLAPPAPSGLNVNPGENKITLIWTEVSGEPDLDYYKIYRDSSTPYDYADAYTIEVDTGNSSYLDTGLSNTVTYYYKMTVVDLGDSGNGLFSHARESAFSNEKSTRPLAEMPTPEAFLTYYSSSTTQFLNETPQCGSWNGSSWASGYDVKRITQTASGWYIVKKCPTAAKWLFGIQDSAKVLNVMIYDESTKAWSAPKKLTTSISYAGCRGFDIEFEQQSGRALVVYKDADTKIPQAITWTDSGGWGSPFALTLSTYGAGTVAWIELAPKQNSNDMLLMIGDSYKDISAHIWFSTSTQTGSSILLDTDIETYGQQCFDGAYEMQSGDAMAAWSPSAGQTVYRIYSSGWGAQQNGPQGIGATIYWVKLAANPNNDAIILGTLDGATPYDVNVSTWNGSNWGTTTEVTPSASVYTTRPFDIAWETASGDGLVVFNDGTSVPKARRLSAGAWGADIPASDVGGAPCYAQLAPDNNSDDILLVTCNDAATPDIHAQKWDGAANSFGSATLITNNSANQNGSSYSHNFAVAYPYVQPTDNTAPAAITTLSASSTTTTGEIRLEWEAPGDNDWSGTLGTYDNNAQFRIQYATYTAFAFGDHTTYDVSIDTYSVNPYDVQSKIISLSKETTYYFRIWTRDEASSANWSGISYGATCWVRVAPAAITTLSALAEDDGDIGLSWIAPGDDGTTGSISDGQWKIRYATFSTVDWTTAASGWADYDDKYELLIDTSCAALSEHAKTISGLHGGVTYYFRIWTRDEATGINAPGNWSSISNASTVCVVKIIGVSVSTNTYNFGEVNLSASTTSISGIVVTNTGNVDEDYSMRVSSVTLFNGSASVWESTDTAVGHNRFILYAIFHDTTAAAGYFVNKDTVTAVNQTSGAERYTYDGGATGDEQRGDGVPKTETRTLWLKLDMPTTVNTSKQEKIKITITAGESP